MDKIKRYNPDLPQFCRAMGLPCQTRDDGSVDMVGHSGRVDATFHSIEDVLEYYRKISAEYYKTHILMYSNDEGSPC